MALDHAAFDALVDGVAARGIDALPELAADLEPGALPHPPGPELGEAVLSRYSERMNAAVFQPLTAGAAHPRALARFLDDISKWVMSDGRQGCLLLNEGAIGRPPDDPVAIRSAAWRGHMKATLTDALHFHSADSAEARERAALLTVCVIGLNTLVRGGAEGDDLFGPFLAIQALVTGWTEPAT